MEKREEPVIVVGVDWATEHHDVCILLPNGEVKEEFQVKHSAEGLIELVTKLSGYSPGEEALVHLGIEVPHGVVVETLMERGVTVFSINPKQLDRFRDRFSVAGCKDDRLDARVLASSLRTDAHCFRRLRALPEPIVRLREWSRIMDDLKDDRVRLQIGSSIGFGRHAQQDVGHEGSPNRPSRVLGRLRWRMAGVRTSAVSAVRGNF